ncbi:MAG: hypothetical protein JSS65_07370 [Armatimonadetes bacterium]|nr:hypothetical protein [Armatimonadota bacterium]
MKKLTLFLCGFGLMLLVGCGESGPTANEDAKMRKALGNGPPSLAGMQEKMKGARQDAGKPGATPAPAGAK